MQDGLYDIIFFIYDTIFLIFSKLIYLLYNKKNVNKYCYF